jgi:hypothetical protein
MRQTPIALVMLALSAAGLTASPASAQPSCNTGTPYTFRAGLMDEFASPSDPVSRGADLVAAFPGMTWKDFDDPRSNRAVGHTFTGLPAAIVRAELVVRARPNYDLPENDAIAIGLVPHSQFATAFRFSDLREAKGTWDVSDNGPTTFTIALGHPYASLFAQMSSTHALDVLVQDDTTVDSMALRVWTCPPPLFSSGLPHSALGQAELHEDAQGHLVISNLGASGADGFAVPIGAGSGWTASWLDLDEQGPLPQGTALSATAVGVAGGTAGKTLGTVRLEQVAGAVQISADFQPVGAATYTLEIRDGGPQGDVVTHLTGQSGAAAQMIRWPISIHVDSLPGGGVRIDIGRRRRPRLEDSFELADGTAVKGDYLCILPESSTAIIGAATQAEIRARGISSFTLVDESVRLFGLNQHALGTATLQPADGHLTVAGALAGDGVAVDLGRSESTHLTLAPIDPLGSAPAGSFLEASATGLFDGHADQPLGKLTVTKEDAGKYVVSADFSDVQSPTQHVQVFRAGELVADFPGHRGEVASTLRWPIDIRKLFLLGGRTKCYSGGWGAGTTFFIDGRSYQGDELRVLAETDGGTIGYLSQIALRSAGIPDLTLTGAETTSCAAPAILRQPVDVTCAAGKPAIFSVAADSASPLTYRWRRNGTDLADGARLAGSGTATLTLSPTILALTGTYDVVVSNACGSVVSAPAAYRPGVALRLLLVALVGDVGDLVAHSTLTPAQGDGLSASLLKSLAFLRGSNLAAAANRLDVFLARVQAFVRAGALTADQGQALTASAAAVRAHFNC